MIVITCAYYIKTEKLKEIEETIREQAKTGIIVLPSGFSAVVDNNCDDTIVVKKEG